MYLSKQTCHLALNKRDRDWIELNKSVLPFPFAESDALSFQDLVNLDVRTGQVTDDISVDISVSTAPLTSGAPP